MWVIIIHGCMDSSRKDLCQARDGQLYPLSHPRWHMKGTITVNVLCEDASRIPVMSRVPRRCTDVEGGGVYKR